MEHGEKEIKYPIGIQTFSEIIEEGYVYVDKTAFIKKLLDGKYYFLSRPRRFGKSLFLSTLKSFYEGRRDLFKGLAIDSLTDEWDSFPVLYLDLNNGSYDSEQGLVDKLSLQIKTWERQFNLPEDPALMTSSLSLRFGTLIERIAEVTGKRVVILIDEYDKPLLNAIDNPALAERLRSILKTFYSNLKTMDRWIKMAFITGVARFSKVSIFSDLNNLRDISFESEFSSICGITAEELSCYFKEGIRKLGSHLNIGSGEVMDVLKKRYDGYHFSKKSPDIYNPFSLVNAFRKGEAGSYWFESGTPTYLVTLLRKLRLPFRNISPIEVDKTVLETGGVMDVDPIPVFYQSGYLTIKRYESDLDTYILEYPNEEVKESFLKFLIRSYVPDMVSGSGFTLTDFIRAVRHGLAEEFMRSLQSLIAGVPYSEKGSAESHFQNVIYLLFTLLGFYCRMEQRTSDGRIDLTVETPHRVYIFEFKVDSTAAKAMEQIRRKQYWLPYSSSAKDIFLIAANFDTNTRRLSDWLIEDVQAD